MDFVSDHRPQLASVSKRLLQRVICICENRLQLFMVEAHEERQKILLAISLAIGVAAFGLLAGISLTVIVALALWDHSPVIAMLVLTLLYASIGTLLFLRLVRLQKNWQALPATLDQLRKDRDLLGNPS